MVKRLVLVPALFLLVLVTWTSAQETIQQAEDLRQIEEQMKAEYEKALKDPEQPAEGGMVLLDIAKGYGYSPESGLWKLESFQPNEEGLVEPREGELIPISPEGLSRLVEEGIVISALYKPFRRVKSKNGYRKTEGYILLPSAANLVGVDQLGEAAYNYFGLDYNKPPNPVGSYWLDVEMGLYAHWTTCGSNVWYVFAAWQSQTIPYHWTDELDDGNRWPSGGIPAGSTVFMRLWVPQDDQVKLYISYSGGSKTFTLNGMTGAKYDGTKQKMRRITNLLVNTEYGMSLYNVWQDVKIATPDDMHLWVENDTLEAYHTSYVTVEETNKYYNETISIQLP